MDELVGTGLANVDVVLNGPSHSFDEHYARDVPRGRAWHTGDSRCLGRHAKTVHAYCLPAHATIEGNKLCITNCGTVQFKIGWVEATLKSRGPCPFNAKRNTRRNGLPMAEAIMSKRAKRPPWPQHKDSRFPSTTRTRKSAAATGDSLIELLARDKTGSLPAPSIPDPYKQRGQYRRRNPFPPCHRSP